MKIAKKRLTEAADVLRMAGMLDISDMLKEIAENKESRTDYAEVVDTNAYVASILWSNEDIRDALEDEGYAVNEENLQTIREYQNCVGEFLGEIIERQSETGYHVIRNAIDELSMDLEPGDKEMED